MSFSRKILLTLSLHYFIASSLFSQEVKKGEVDSYARKIVDTMASESMHGRGYVNGGDSIAANYIRTEFQKFGLKSFTDDYYQKFSFAVNTFPGKVKLDFGFKDVAGKQSFFITGHPGANFIIDPSSPYTYTDGFLLKVFDSLSCSEKGMKKFSRKLKKNDFVLVDDRGVTQKEKMAYFNKAKINSFHAAGIIEIVKKLTWDQSQIVRTFPSVQILSDSFSYKLNPKMKGYGWLEIRSKYLPSHNAQNVISYVKGSIFPDSFIVYSAHYDHLGQMGDSTYFPGANDNASGCAMLLNLAKYYSMPEHKPKYSIVFMAFCGEEVGLLGSKYYTEHPLFPMKNIRFLLNMDIMGTGEDGITVVNGSVFKTEFDKLKQINTENNFIKDVKIRGKAANSDHYFFSEKGVKACFIYAMGGIKAYHDIYDRAETLPLNEFEDLFKLITKFGDYLQQ